MLICLTILFLRCDGICELTIYPPGLNPKKVKYDSKSDHKIEEHLRYGYINGDHLDGDKIAYAKQASEGCMYIIFPNLKDTHIKGIICEGTFPETKVLDVIFVSFNETDLVQICPTAKERQHSVKKVRVVFELKYSYFFRQHDTLDAISDEVIAKILPSSDKEFTHQSKFREGYHLSGRHRKTAELDSIQFTALKAIMMCDPKAPFLIVGSFGTGKTRLLARAAMQIVQEDCKARVLVCAHHQSSADSFVIKYFSKMKVNMLRLMNPWYSPPPGYEKYYKTAKVMRNYACDVQLIVTTLGTSLHLHGIIKQGHFTHILMDEGAQSREPEAVAPLTFANQDTKIIIAGDHKQVCNLTVNCLTTNISVKGIAC